MRFCIIVLLNCVGATAQVTLDVPAAFPTIQAAIGAAAPGDTVLVAPGTYLESGIDLLGKAITVRSSAGADVTTIECGSFGDGFVFQSGETPMTVVEGFTLRNSPVLGGGTAFVVTGASPRLVDIRVPMFINLALPAGAVISGEPVFERCEFAFVSSAFGLPGGIEVRPSPTGGSVVFDRCSFGNMATTMSSGGAIFVLAGAAAEFRSSYFRNQTAVTALDVFGSVTLDGCTCTGSSSFANVRAGGTLAITSSIAWNNGPVGIHGAGVITASHSNIEHGAVTGPGVIDVDPQFDDASLGTLQATSPCIDAGDPASANVTARDRFGEVRIIATHDMGCHEVAYQFLAGTSEDLTLETPVNGSRPGAPVNLVTAGDRLEISLESPAATFVGSTPLILAQVFTTGPVPASPFPGIAMDPSLPNAPIVALFDPFATGGPFGTAQFPAAGIHILATVPPSLAGLSVVVQGYALTSSAANTIFASTDAHELRGTL